MAVEHLKTEASMTATVIRNRGTEVILPETTDIISSKIIKSENAPKDLTNNQ